MGTFAPFVILISLVIMAVTTVSGTYLSRTEPVADSLAERAKQESDLGETAIELIGVNYDDTDVQISLRNTGRVQLRDFASWDVWGSYYEADDTYHPVRFAYTASNPPGAGEWTVSDIFVASEAGTPEAYRPGILDPDEEITLIVRPAHAVTGLQFNIAKVAPASSVQVTLAFTSGALSPTPSAVGGGGALTDDDLTSIYAFRGDNTRTFWRYDITADEWTGLKNTEANPNKGGSVAYATDGVSHFVYALRGAGKTDFWRYDIANNTWDSMADTPAKVNNGGALTWDGADTLYAFKGGKTATFWSYSIAGDTWTPLADVPKNIDQGGFLAYHDGLVYGLRGGKHKEMYAYDVGAGTWSRLADAPTNIKQGGALEHATDGGGGTTCTRCAGRIGSISTVTTSQAIAGCL
jgi:predicted lipoprotein with Yx(FWY)xxD motif